jgi:hypothetical protein
MTEKSSSEARPLIGFITRDNAPQISPAPISRTWMSEMAELRMGWPNRCLPMLIADQSGWELRNPCGFTATWMGQQGVDVMIAPDKRDAGQLLPASHFGDGILTWHLPILFRTPPGYNLLVRGPANYPKDAVSPLEGIVETDWASTSFSMNWKFTRKLMPVRFEVDESICLIVPQRRNELEEFAPSSGASSPTKICSASMSSSSAHVTRKGWPRRRRSSGGRAGGVAGRLHARQAPGRRGRGSRSPDAPSSSFV